MQERDGWHPLAKQGDGRFVISAEDYNFFAAMVFIFRPSIMYFLSKFVPATSPSTAPAVRV